MDSFAFSITLPRDPALLGMFRDLAAAVCRATGAGDAACGEACAGLEALVADRLEAGRDGAAPVTIRFARETPSHDVTVEISGPATPGDDRRAARPGAVQCETDGRRTRLRLTWAASRS